jgi:hypothetical protein
MKYLEWIWSLLSLEAIAVCFFCIYLPYTIIFNFNLPWFIPSNSLYFFGGMIYSSYLKSVKQ